MDKVVVKDYKSLLCLHTKYLSPNFKTLDDI